MTTEDLIAYYQNLLIIQYRPLPKARGTVGVVCSSIIADQIVAQVRDGFDLSTAIGNQLDILGVYVGARRALPDYTPSNTYFALPAYSDVGAGSYVGFASYSDVNPPTGDWRLYTTTDVTLTLTDGQMRNLIQYLVALNASDHSNESLDKIFAQFFGGYTTITDNGNMTVTYTHNAADPFILFDIVNFIGALPHPAGVTVIVA